MKWNIYIILFATFMVLLLGAESFQPLLNRLNVNVVIIHFDVLLYTLSIRFCQSHSAFIQNCDWLYR
jgi:hypothetical protein